MKIYKLDIDTSKPIRKVVQMQQNATGALSVDVTNDGWPIRNLSCALYEGDTQLSAYDEPSSGAGYKIDMGTDTKVVKFTAKSEPVECSAEYIVKNGTTRLQGRFFNYVQLSTGVYKQEEFYRLAERFGNKEGVIVDVKPTATTLSNVNFDLIYLRPWVIEQPVDFYEQISANAYKLMPKDTLISVDGFVALGQTKQVKTQGLQVSSYTYPAVGYWTDYSLDTVIRPSENAHCYAEQEVSDPTPDPEPEPEPEPDTPPDEDQTT